MKLGFSGPAPQAKTLEEVQFIINELWEMLKVIPALQCRVKALEK